MKFFAIAGMIFWLIVVILAFCVVWPHIAEDVKNFFPNLWYVISSFWGDAYSKQGELNLLIAKREGKMCWATKAAKWILRQRTR